MKDIILFVDDEINILRAIKRIFINSDYEILTASSAQQGLTILSQYPFIKVVVTDFQMPNMNGMEFLKIIENTWPSTVRIIMTGSSEMHISDILFAVQNKQIYKYMRKPWSNQELLLTVKNAVEHYRRFSNQSN